jgi:hypothetical protein
VAVYQLPGTNALDLQSQIKSKIELSKRFPKGNFFNTGGTLPPAFVSIFGLTGANLGNALSQLSGEAATGGQQASFQLANQFLGIMLDPFVDGRSGVAGANGPALGFAPEREELPEDIALAYAKVLKAPPKPRSFEQRWSVWGDDAETASIIVNGRKGLC